MRVAAGGRPEVARLRRMASAEAVLARPGTVISPRADSATWTRLHDMLRSEAAMVAASGMGGGTGFGTGGTGGTAGVTTGVGCTGGCAGGGGGGAAAAPFGGTLAERSPRNIM